MYFDEIGFTAYRQMVFSQNMWLKCLCLSHKSVLGTRKYSQLP